MNLKKAVVRDFKLPAPGKYPCKITSAESVISRNGEGSPMVKIAGELTQGDFAGVQFFDNILTESEWNGEEVKGAGIGKKKLQGMGFDVENVEMTDDELCNALLGRECIVQVKHEAQREQNDKGVWVPKKGYDESGKEVVIKRLAVVGYSTVDVGGRVQGVQPVAAQPFQVPGAVTATAPVQQPVQQPVAAAPVAAAPVPAAPATATPPWMAAPAVAQAAPAK